VAANATRRGTLYQGQTFDATRGRPQHWLVELNRCAVGRRPVFGYPNHRRGFSDETIISLRHRILSRKYAVNTISYNNVYAPFSGPIAPRAWTCEIGSVQQTLSSVRQAAASTGIAGARWIKSSSLCLRPGCGRRGSYKAERTDGEERCAAGTDECLLKHSTVGTHLFICSVETRRI
jgi:hypothetical protein